MGNSFNEGDRIKVYGQPATVVKPPQFGATTGWVRVDGDPIPRVTFVEDWKRV